MADFEKAYNAYKNCSDPRFDCNKCIYLNNCKQLDADILELLKEQKPKRAYTVVQIRGAFAEAVNDMVKSPLADSVYFHLMGKIEEHLS